MVCSPSARIFAWTWLEDLVTAAPQRGRGHGDALLATGLALAAAGIPQLFLIADATDWPRTLEPETCIGWN